jgi:ribonuclease-3
MSNTKPTKTVRNKRIRDLEAILDYSFTNPSLLDTALTHRSFSSAHNERLEFIGDSVLNCVVATTLYSHFPALPEGDLSRIRARLVSADALAKVALQIGLSTFLRLGDGELKSGGATRASILSDAMEAVFGAVMMDAGFETARQVIYHVYGEQLTEADPERLGKDAKTRLQEWLQGYHEPRPEYTVTDVKGEAHEQLFIVSCAIRLLDQPVIGEGTSRRGAEQNAAEKALEALQQIPGLKGRRRLKK